MTSPAATLFAALQMDGPPLDWACTETRTLRIAWATCPHADWLVDVAARLGVDRRIVVRAALDCVAIGIAHVDRSALPWRILALVDAWVDGDSSDATCRAAASVARNAVAELEVASHRRTAAFAAVAHLALACDTAASATAWARDGHAAKAVATVYGLVTSRGSADAARHWLPYEHVAPFIAHVIGAAPRADDSGTFTYPRRHRS